MKRSEIKDIRDILTTRKKCPKCGHERGDLEIAADYECPKCGIIYDKFVQTKIQSRSEASPELGVDEDQSVLDELKVQNDDSNSVKEIAEDSSIEETEDRTEDILNFSEAIPRPWRRFFARQLDILVLGFPVFIIIYAILLVVTVILTPKFGKDLIDWASSKYFDNIALIITITLYLPLEIFLLSNMGNTPFKKMFGLRIETINGGPLSKRQIIDRSVGVWSNGCGVGIVYPITFAINFFKLKKTGFTSWDYTNGTMVTSKSLSLFRWFVCVISILLSPILIGFIVFPVIIEIFFGIAINFI